MLEQAVCTHGVKWIPASGCVPSSVIAQNHESWGGNPLEIFPDAADMIGSYPHTPMKCYIQWGRLAVGREHGACLTVYLRDRLTSRQPESISYMEKERNTVSFAL